MDKLDINNFIDNYSFYKSKGWLEDLLFDPANDLEYDFELSFDDDNDFTILKEEEDSNGTN